MFIILVCRNENYSSLSSFSFFYLNHIVLCILHIALNILNVLNLLCNNGFIQEKEVSDQIHKYQDKCLIKRLKNI